MFKFYDLLNITKNNITLLINGLEKVENQLPDDQWDEHHWKGFKSGIIESIGILSGKSLNYHLTSQELRDIFNI